MLTIFTKQTTSNTKEKKQNRVITFEASSNINSVTLKESVRKQFIKQIDSDELGVPCAKKRKLNESESKAKESSMSSEKTV